MSISDLIRRTPRPILAMATVLILAAGFFFYKAATAFGPQETSPAYERTPNQAFALPQVPTIVDPAKLGEDRLPDDVYENVTATSEKLTAAIASQQLTVGQLTAAGMSESDALSALDLIEQSYSIYKGRQPLAVDDLNVSLLSEASVEAVRYFDVPAGEDGSPGTTGTVTANFGGKSWQLQYIGLSLGA